MPVVAKKKRPVAPAPKSRAGVAVRTSRTVMDAAHAAAVVVQPGPMNVEPALELGDVLYVTFRGRPYGVPPVPWRVTERLHLEWIQARSYPTPLTPDTAPLYYAAMRGWAEQIWRYTRPVGRLRRLLKAVGLLSNPFRQATEQELVELAGFFLLRRATSSIGLLPPTASRGARTS